MVAITAGVVYILAWIVGLVVASGRLSPADPQMAKLGLYSALAASATSLAHFIVGVTFTYDAAHNGNANTVRDLGS